MSTVPVVAVNANVLDAYFSTVLSRASCPRRLYPAGARHGPRLGLHCRPTRPSRQKALLLFNLIVKFGLSRLRYLQPADAHVMPQFAGGRIKALKRQARLVAQWHRVSTHAADYHSEWRALVLCRPHMAFARVVNGMKMGHALFTAPLPKGAGAP